MEERMTTGVHSVDLQDVGRIDPKYMTKAGKVDEILRLRRENDELQEKLREMKVYLSINRGLGLGVDKLSELVESRSREAAEHAVWMLRADVQRQYWAEKEAKETGK